MLAWTMNILLLAIKMSWLLSLDLLFQDVVEIMKESLYDKFVDEHGVVDFGRSGGMSQQKEARRFLSALDKQSELQQKDCYSVSVWTTSILQNLATRFWHLWWPVSYSIEKNSAGAV